MSVKVLQAVEARSYLTDGKRLLFVLSLSEKEALCEDAAHPKADPVTLTVKELARKWRRVHQNDKEKV